MALSFSQVRSASPPADDIPGLTNPLSGCSDALANNPTGQPSLAVELPAGPAEETLFGEALLRQAHQNFHKAQQSLATAYAKQGLAVPPGVRVKHRQPKAAAGRTTRDTPLRVSAAAGAKEPSRAYSSGLSVRSNPYAEGGASKRSAAWGLLFIPPRVRRIYRLVSQDLPFSLVASKPTWVMYAGYRDDASIVSDMYKHASFVDTGDKRQHDLSPKLRAARALPSKAPSLTTRPPGYASKKATLSRSTDRQAPLRAPRPASGLTSLADELVPSDTREIQQEYAEPEPESPASYDRADMDKILLKQRPTVLDLDDSSSVQFFCIRYETMCLRHGANPDCHTALIELRLQQGTTSTYQEKTRLWALLKYSQQARYESGDLNYTPFKAVLSQVAVGERVFYTRKTLSTLSQKASGSFDRFLTLRPSVATLCLVTLRSLKAISRRFAAQSP